MEGGKNDNVFEDCRIAIFTFSLRFCCNVYSLTNGPNYCFEIYLLWTMPAGLEVIYFHQIWLRASRNQFCPCSSGE
jgi:hypothetical protein